MMVNVIYLILLLAPHAAIILAWTFWLRWPARLQLPKWRRIALFLAVLAGSLNIVMYWGYVSWLHLHYTSDAWKGRDFVYNIWQYLFAGTIIGALFGTGRVRITLCIAGILGFFLWVTTSIGIL